MPELAWTDKKPTEPGRYAYLRYPGATLGDLLRIFLDGDGVLRRDYGCTGNLPLGVCDDGHWLGPLPEMPETQEEEMPQK